MRRLLFVLGGAIVLMALDADGLFAQVAGQVPGQVAGGAAQAAPFVRGPGFYLNVWKVGVAWLVFAAWVKTTDWINQDAQLKGLNYAMWNPIVFFSFVVTFVLLWIIPSFMAGFPLMLIAWVAPLVTYIVQRNAAMPHPDDKVLTSQHLRRVIATQANKVGIKMATEATLAYQLGPNVQFVPQAGADAQANQGLLIAARQSPAFVPAKQMFSAASLNRSDGIMLDYGATGVLVRYLIDGVWHDHAPMERAVGDGVLAILKTVAGLNPNERRAKQVGQFGLEIAGAKLVCKIVSQGTQSGERVLLQTSSTKSELHSLEALGMRAKMQEQLLEILRGAGFVVFSSVPGGGLTTMVDGVLESMDRFIRNFASVEDVQKPEHEIENVPATTYDTTADETPDSVLPKLIRTYPDVVIVRDPVNAETLSILCEQVPENRLVMTTVRAKEAVEALLRILQYQVPPAEFAPAVTAVLNQRLVRRLCEKCKEAYRPPADVVKQLGLPPNRIEAFYQPPTQPIDPKHPEKVCDNCMGVGYRGRTAIFELLVVDDQIREVLTTSPKLDALRAAARQARHRGLQEEGVLLVARGITSLQEVMRVLKQ